MHILLGRNLQGSAILQHSRLVADCRCNEASSTGIHSHVAKKEDPHYSTDVTTLCYRLTTSTTPGQAVRCGLPSHGLSTGQWYALTATVRDGTWITKSSASSSLSTNSSTCCMQKAKLWQPNYSHSTRLSDKNASPHKDCSIESSGSGISSMLALVWPQSLYNVW